MTLSVHVCISNHKLKLKKKMIYANEFFNDRKWDRDSLQAIKAYDHPVVRCGTMDLDWMVQIPAQYF